MTNSFIASVTADYKQDRKQKRLVGQGVEWLTPRQISARHSVINYSFRFSASTMLKGGAQNMNIIHNRAIKGPKA